MLGYDVLTFDDLKTDYEIVIAVGDGHVRQLIEARCIAAGLSIASVSASSALVCRLAQIGHGAVFSDFTMVTAPAVIGRQFQCNIYSYVAHDCVIGDYVTFAPSVHCNGNVTIGDFAYIGTGALIRQGITIGAHAVIGMGAVVVKDVSAGETVMGNPARSLVSSPRSSAAPTEGEPLANRARVNANLQA